MTSNDVVAELSANKYSVKHGMTPKQTIEGMNLTQQYSSINRQVVYKWHRRFSTEWKESGAKKGHPTELNKGILQTVPYVSMGDRQCS